MTALQLRSPLFDDGEEVPSRCGIDGANVNPPLAIANVPPAAASLALVAEDLDIELEVGHRWYNWGVWDIDPDRTHIPEGWSPTDAVVARNDFDDRTYSGPDPHGVDHECEFRLYALPSTPNLLETAPVGRLDSVAREDAIATATLRGVYPQREASSTAAK